MISMHETFWQSVKETGKAAGKATGKFVFKGVKEGGKLGFAVSKNMIKGAGEGVEEYNMNRKMRAIQK